MRQCPLCTQKHLLMAKGFLEEAFERGAERCVDPRVLPAIDSVLDEVHGYGNPHSHSHLVSRETRKLNYPRPRYAQDGSRRMARRRGYKLPSVLGGQKSGKILGDILFYTAAGFGGQLFKIVVERYANLNPQLQQFFFADLVLIVGGFGLAFVAPSTIGRRWSPQVKAAVAFAGLTAAVGRLFEYFRTLVGFGITPTFTLPGPQILPSYSVTPVPSRVATA